MSAEGYTFQNSESCRGIGIVTSTGHSHDVITVRGDYPQEGYWARNHEAREEIVIAAGQGELVLRGSDAAKLDAQGKNGVQVAIVEPNTWFRWRSTDGMIISMVCMPGFDPEKYELKSEQELENEI
jgi:predicted cupin superfamily sugar epimerase